MPGEVFTAHIPTIIDFLTPVQNDVIDAATWAGAIVPTLFLLAYTFGPARAKWWKNVAGQTIVALDVCLLALFIPRSISLAAPSQVSAGWHVWLSFIATCVVPFVAGYRIWALIKHARQKKVKPTGWVGKGGPEDAEGNDGDGD